MINGRFSELSKHFLYVCQFYYFRGCPMVKIAILHNIITPYRLDLFEKLSKHKYIDELNVFYFLEERKDRKWNLKYEAGYEYKILPGYTLMLPLIKIPCSINLSIFSEIRKDKYDVVIISGFTDVTAQLAYIKCKIENIPVILWSELTGNYLSKFNTLYFLIASIFIKHSDAVIVPSTKSKNYHTRLSGLTNNIFISPNTIDGDKYINKSKKYWEASDLIKKNLSITTKKNILFVGRFIKLKCIDNLIKAYISIKADMDDVGLILVGDGPEKSHLKELCRNAGIKDVYFQGFVSGEDEKIKYYSISDILVLPSLFELHPLVLPEAMACSLPIITTKVVGSANDNIVNGKNGYIIDTENVEQLRYTLMKILSDNNIKYMGSCSLQIFNEKCSLDIAVEGLVNAIKYVKDR